jgi:transcriptional regulator with GAF, ATPase, and Fis domain
LPLELGSAASPEYRTKDSVGYGACARLSLRLLLPVRDRHTADFVNGAREVGEETNHGYARKSPTPIHDGPDRQGENVSTTQDNATEDAQHVIAGLRHKLDAALRETAVAEVLAVINSSPSDPGPVFEAILERAHRLCSVALGSLATFDGTFLNGIVSHNYPDQFADALRRPYRPFLRHQPLLFGDKLVQFQDLLADVEALEEEVSRGVTSHLAIRTYLMVPMRKDGAQVGFISAARQENRPFSENEITLLESFSAQAVIAIENTRLLTEQREVLERQTATAESIPRPEISRRFTT